MIKKKKLLICALLMSMVVSFMPGMESNAAELSGGGSGHSDTSG